MPRRGCGSASPRSGPLLRPGPGVAFEARRVRAVSVSRSALGARRGGLVLGAEPLGGPAGDGADRHRRTDAALPRRGGRTPPQPFGGRRVDYRHYLGELARKPQAVRQVAPELVAALGEPFGRLWARLEREPGRSGGGRAPLRGCCGPWTSTASSACATSWSRSLSRSASTSSPCSVCSPRPGRRRQ